jgi:hypothetical protein
MKIVSVAVINVDNTAKPNILGFRGYIYITIFNYRPMVCFGARKTDKKVNISRTFQQ